MQIDLFCGQDYVLVAVGRQKYSDLLEQLPQSADEETEWLEPCSIVAKGKGGLLSRHGGSFQSLALGVLLAQCAARESVEPSQELHRSWPFQEQQLRTFIPHPWATKHHR
jgi:hypothetical protein